jgi:antitoxin (DNA-binding transcriptional repressor) of toxin-antitoxin stability system
MSTVTERAFQKNFKSALLRVERGESLGITRRRRVVAHLTPAATAVRPAKKPAPWPDLAARSAKIMALGKPGQVIDAGQYIVDARGTW